MLSHFSHVQLFMSQWSVHGILQARLWSGLPCPPPEDLPDSGLEHTSLTFTSPVLPGRFFFFLTTSSTWEALWSPLLTDKQMETRGEKPHPWQRVCLGSAANRLCDLFPLAGYLWFISSAVQWMSWTRILVNSGRKVLDSNIPSIFCRFCGLLPEEQVRWLSEFHSACQPIW